MISQSENSFIREPPALSGMLIDWSIGPREITATITDLVLRGLIKYSSQGLRRGAKKSYIRLCNFEEKIIEILFSESKFITYEEFGQKIYGTEYERIVNIIFNGAVEEGYIKQEFQQHLIREARLTANDIIKIQRFVDPDKKINIKELPLWTSRYSEIIRSLFSYSWVFPIISLALLLIFHNEATLYMFIYSFFLIPLFGILYVIFWPAFYRSQYGSQITRKFGPMEKWDKTVLTEKGRIMKKRSEDMKEYFKKYPVYNDTAATEFIPQAIALGIGEEWMERLGKEYARLRLLEEKIMTQNEKAIQLIDFKKYLNDQQ